MNFKIAYTPNFEREAKRLAKKYPSLKNDLSILVEELKEKPATGTLVFKNVYKVRLAISAKGKGKGKSGGACVMTYVQINKESITLFSIFSKGEKDTITDKEIILLLQEIE